MRCIVQVNICDVSSGANSVSVILQHTHTCTHIHTRILVCHSSCFCTLCSKLPQRHSAWYHSIICILSALLPYFKSRRDTLPSNICATSSAMSVFLCVRVHCCLLVNECFYMYNNYAVRMC
jgi:hypothetical protein